MLPGLQLAHRIRRVGPPEGCTRFHRRARALLPAGCRYSRSYRPPPESYVKRWCSVQESNPAAPSLEGRAAHPAPGARKVEGLAGVEPATPGVRSSRWWYPLRDSNSRLSRPKREALSAELRGHHHREGVTLLATRAGRLPAQPCRGRIGSPADTAGEFHARAQDEAGEASFPRR